MAMTDRQAAINLECGIETVSRYRRAKAPDSDGGTAITEWEQARIDEAMYQWLAKSDEVDAIDEGREQLGRRGYEGFNPPMRRRIRSLEQREAPAWTDAEAG